jgi:hypothetical protein
LFFVFDGEALRLYEEKRSSRASARVNLLDMVVDVEFVRVCVWLCVCAMSWHFIWGPGRRLAVRCSSCSCRGAVESRRSKSEVGSGARVVWRRVCDYDRVSGGECAYKGWEANCVPWGIVVERTLFFDRGSEQVASEVRRSWVVLTPRRLGNTLLQRRRRVRARVVVD